MNNINFGASFLNFTSDRIPHTPRLQIDAVCSIQPLHDSKKPMRTFYLTVACIGERMYEGKDLIQQPVVEFNLIAAPGEEFLMIKRAANARDGMRTAHRVGEAMPTHSGVDSHITSLLAGVKRHSKVKPITTYAEFKAALVENRRMNGRTTYESAGFRAVLDYPAKTINVSHAQEAWQVDAGPLLLLSEPASGDLDVTRLNIGYLVYDGWNRADYTVLADVRLAENLKTPHYASAREMSCRNELYEVLD